MWEKYFGWRQDLKAPWNPSELITLPARNEGGEDEKVRAVIYTVAQAQAPAFIFRSLARGCHFQHQTHCFLNDFEARRERMEH